MRHVCLLPIVALAVAGCTETPTMTVADFMENEAALYGTLARCDRDPASVDPAECRNAGQAAERIATIEERAMRKAREQAFESAREEYRQRLDRERELRREAEAAAQAARLEALLALESGDDSEQETEAPAP